MHMRVPLLPLFRPSYYQSDSSQSRKLTRYALAILIILLFYTSKALLVFLRNTPEVQVVDHIHTPPSTWCANALSSLRSLLPVSPFLLPMGSFVSMLPFHSPHTITASTPAQLVSNVIQTPIPDPDVELTTPTWENLRPGEHCLRYATREYTARLANAPNGADGFRACKSTPVVIHGREMYPTFCQDLGFGRGVWGFWSVNFDEPGCETRWGRFTDLGCEDTLIDSDETSPVRRIESKLKNLQPGSNWQIMCVTTPADIAGQHFATPAECMNAGQNGIFGHWEIQDRSCD